MTNIEKPTESATENPITVEEEKHLTGREGLDLLKSSTSTVEGINLCDYLKTPEGQEAMDTKKFVLAGPPRSGKSCLRQGIKNVTMKKHGGSVYPYMFTACPDGEGSWFQETMNADPVLAAKLKADYKSRFSPEFAEMKGQGVQKLSLPLSFIDIGGIISPENAIICKHANGAILIAGETAVKMGAPAEWKKFFTELGIPLVAELYSDYLGSEDLVEGVGEDGVFRGTVHHLERGEDLTNRRTIQELSDFIINLGK